MKRPRAILLMLIFLMASFLTTGIGHRAQAAGGAPTYVSLTASSTSAVADGTKITLTVFVYRLNCPGNVVPNAGTNCEDGSTPTHKGLPGREVWFSSSAAVSFEGAYPCLGGYPCVKSGEDGKAQLTVAATTAATADITGRIDVGWGNIDPASVTLTFKSAVTPAPVKPKTPTAAPAPAPAPVVEKPAAPTMATVSAGGEEVKNNDPVSITTSESLTLNGKTVPNGKVAVYVFSDPKLFETTADKDGNWSVEVKDLPEGSHHAEVEVTNPANNQKSDRARLLDFSVVADTKPIMSTDDKSVYVPKSTSYGRLWVLLGTLVVIVAGLLGYIFWKRKHKKANGGGNSSDPTPITTIAPNPDASSADDSSDSDTSASSSDGSPSSSDDSPASPDGK